MREPPTAACPRCEYDLAAELLKWQDSCPITGRCWECGLHIEWSDVLRPERRREPRFVEHSVGWQRTLAASWRTWAWALWPPLFWSRVRLELLPRPRRWLVWLLWTAGLFLTLSAVAQNAQTVREFGARVAFSFRDDVRTELFNAWLAPLGSIVRSWQGLRSSGHTFEPCWTDSPLGTAYAPLLGASIIAPLMLLVLPYTRARAKVRAVHVGRAAVFGLAWLPVVLTGATIANVHSAMARARPWLSGVPRGVVAIGGKWLYVVQVWGYALLPFALVWLAFWWWCTLRRGWRLEQPRRVWLAVMVGVGLAVGVGLLLDRRFVDTFLS